MHANQRTAQEILQEIGERRHIPIGTFGGNHISLRTRLILLYRLLVRANETRVQIQGVQAARQREVALKMFWQDGGDLGC